VSASPFSSCHALAGLDFDTRTPFSLVQGQKSPMAAADRPQGRIDFKGCSAPRKTEPDYDILDDMLLNDEPGPHANYVQRASRLSWRSCSTSRCGGYLLQMCFVLRIRGPGARDRDLVCRIRAKFRHDRDNGRGGHSSLVDAVGRWRSTYVGWAASCMSWGYEETGLRWRAGHRHGSGVACQQAERHGVALEAGI